MITLDELRIIARCGACHKPLVDKEIRLVMLTQTGVLWLPSWRLGKARAVGVVCMDCIKGMKEPDEAIEVNEKNDRVIYHKLKDMEATEEHGTEGSTEEGKDNSRQPGNERRCAEGA